MPRKAYPPSRISTLTDDELKAVFQAAKACGEQAARQRFAELDQVTQNGHTFASGSLGGAVTYTSDISLKEKNRLRRLLLLEWAPTGRYSAQLRFDLPDGQSYQVALAAATAAAEHLSSALDAPFLVHAYSD